MPGRVALPDSLTRLFALAESAYEKYRLGEGDLEAANESVTAFVTQLEQFRLENPRSRLDLAFSGRYDVYESAVDIAYSLGQELEAFEYAERARARSLLDQTLNKARLRFRMGADTRLLQEEAELSRKVDAFTRRWNERVLLGAGIGSGATPYVSNPAPDEVKLEAELRYARADLLRVRQLIRERDPAFAALRGITPASLADTQTLLDRETALIAYCLLEERLILFIVTQKDFWTEHVDLPRRELSLRISRLREMIESMRGQTRDIVLVEGPPVLGKPLDDDLHLLATELYDILVGPAEPHIRRKSRLAIVPHGDLHLLPFNALRSQRGYLVREFAIWYSPSISLLDLCYQRQRRSRGRLFAVGNPRLGHPKWDLPFAEQEVLAIAPLFDAQIRTGAQATLGELRAEWGQTDLLHLACHAEWDARQPEFSALLLSPAAADTGRLEVQELLTLDHDLPLGQVTLSACQTSMVAGNDVTGLATGFLYAGAPAVVASLWRVDDGSTSDLMVNFYHALATRNRAAALQSAQLDLLRSEAYRHPYFWAPFRLMGNSLRLDSAKTHTASAFHSMHLWTYRPESGGLVRPTLRGSLIFATWTQPEGRLIPQRAVYAISLKQKGIQWRRDISGWPRTFCYVPGLVHVEAGSRVFALRESDGDIVWEHKMGSSLTQSLLFDGKFLFAGGNSASVYALDPETGKIHWQHELPRDGSGGFALGGGLVFVGCNNHSVYALKAANGFRMWRSDLGMGEWPRGHSWLLGDKLETEIGTFDVKTGNWDAGARLKDLSLERGRVPAQLLDRLLVSVDVTLQNAHVLRTADLLFVIEIEQDSARLHMFDAGGVSLLRRYDLPARGATGMSCDGEMLVVGDGNGALHCFSLARTRPGA